MEKTSTSMAEMAIDEDGILHIRIKKGVHFTKENTLEHFARIREFTKGKKMLVLLDASDEYTLTSEAREYLNSDEANEGRIALAFVTGSLANRLLFNLVTSLNREKLPRKMFSDKEKALQWLRSFFILPGDKHSMKRKR